jgi:hypothetical protein
VRLIRPPRSRFTESASRDQRNRPHVGWVDQVPGRSRVPALVGVGAGRRAVPLQVPCRRLPGLGRRWSSRPGWLLRSWRRRRARTSCARSGPPRRGRDRSCVRDRVRGRVGAGPTRRSSRCGRPPISRRQALPIHSVGEVLDVRHQVRAVADEVVTSGGQAGGDWAGNRHDRPSQAGGRARDAQGSAARSGLDDHGGNGHRGQQLLRESSGDRRQARGHALVRRNRRERLCLSYLRVLRRRKSGRACRGGRNLSSPHADEQGSSYLGGGSVNVITG